MSLNPCPIFQTLKIVSIDICETFSNGIVAQGVAVSLARQFENFRKILDIFNNINNQAFMERNSKYIQFFSISNNQSYDNLINLLNSEIKIKISPISLYLYDYFQFIF